MGTGCLYAAVSTILRNWQAIFRVISQSGNYDSDTVQACLHVLSKCLDVKLIDFCEPIEPQETTLVRWSGVAKKDALQ